MTPGASWKVLLAMASHICSIAYLAWWDKILPQASIEQPILPSHENLVIILLRASGAFFVV